MPRREKTEARGGGGGRVPRREKTEPRGWASVAGAAGTAAGAAAAPGPWWSGAAEGSGLGWLGSEA